MGLSHNALCGREQIMGIITLDKINKLKHEVSEIRGILNTMVRSVAEASGKLQALENEILDLALDEES